MLNVTEDNLYGYVVSDINLIVINPLATISPASMFERNVVTVQKNRFSLLYVNYCFLNGFSTSEWNQFNRSK